jgi:hypothetical protein
MCRGQVAAGAPVLRVCVLHQSCRRRGASFPVGSLPLPTPVTLTGDCDREPERHLKQPEDDSWFSAGQLLFLPPSPLLWDQIIFLFCELCERDFDTCTD